MAKEGHHSWCNSNVDIRIASCCQQDAVAAEQAVIRALKELDKKDNECRCPILSVGDHCPVHGG